MGNQKNRLTATKTLNHLVRLFYRLVSKEPSVQAECNGPGLGSMQRMWRALRPFTGAEWYRVGKILPTLYLPYTYPTPADLIQGAIAHYTLYFSDYSWRGQDSRVAIG